jgi:ABC-type sugar transport system substrate-binding protein
VAFKTFVAGEILTAADVNSNLMNQMIATFADASARGSAIPSPVEGQFTFRTDDDVLEFWDGSQWREL